MQMVKQTKTMHKKCSAIPFVDVGAQFGNLILSVNHQYQRTTCIFINFKCFIKKLNIAVAGHISEQNAEINTKIYIRINMNNEHGKVKNYQDFNFKS